jgi:thiosulfate/3-mercaptopyruvate sulfurtransferase
VSPLVVLQLAVFARPEALVDAAWLAAHLNDAQVRIVDVRAQGYPEAHIPGAVRLDYRATRDPGNRADFVPSRAEFESSMGRLGIGPATQVVAYDERGGIYASRLWWLLHYFSHERVALLDGGWLEWKRQEQPTSTETPVPPPAVFRATPDPRWLAASGDVMAAIRKTSARIVDARTAAEIDGTELRGIKRGGRIPSSIPVYWEDALDPQRKTFKSPAELARLYRERGVLPEHEVIAYCQVGLRASHDLFVLYLLGYDRLRNYLGSWEEWGNRDDLPIETGPRR